MMIEPPIEALLKTTNGNHYKLCVLASKRAKDISNKNYFNGVIPNDGDTKEITKALNEIYDGELVVEQNGEQQV